MTLAEQYIAHWGEMEKQAAAKDAAGKAASSTWKDLKGQAGDLKDVFMGRHPAASPGTKWGVRAAVAAPAAVGAGLLARKLLKKKTLGQKLVSGFKKNRKALAIGGGAAAGAAGLAAFMKSRKDK